MKWKLKITILKKGAEATFEEKFVWTDNATKLFLSTYKQKKKLVEQRKIKTLKAMWVAIIDEMNRNDYRVTKVQVENRYKTLERAYKGTVSNNSKTGRGRKSCNFETEVININTMSSRSRINL